MTRKAGTPDSTTGARLARTMRVSAPRRPDATVGAGEGSALPKSPSVLLLVDFINPLDFPGAQHLAEPALAAAKATARLKARLERDGVACIYANDNYGVWRSEFSDVRRLCESLPGAPGEIARLLRPQHTDLAMLKPRHSAFFGTPLDIVLTQMDAKRLVIVGLAADICVQLSAMDANLRGYKLWVPSDCTAAESPEIKAQALEYLRRVLKADTASAARRRVLS